MMSGSYFQVQLSAILDVLVKAAAADISALAERVFSSLQEQVERCASENRDLRRKLQEQNALSNTEAFTMKTSDTNIRPEECAVRKSADCKRKPINLESDTSEVESDLGHVEPQELNCPLEEIKEELMEMCVTQSVENTVDVVVGDQDQTLFPVIAGSKNPEIKTESENKATSHVLQTDWIDCIPAVDYEEESKSCLALERDLELENGSTQHVPCTQSIKQPHVGTCMSRAPDWRCNVTRFNVTARASICRNVQERSGLICYICGKMVLSKQGLRVHLKVHAGQRPYTCPQCGKSFTRKATLNFHQNIHTGAKPYGCNICPKSFADPSALRRHKSIHKGVH